MSDSGQSRLFSLYDRLDRLEELIEDMAALGVRSLDDAEALIEAVNQEIDELETHDHEP